MVVVMSQQMHVLGAGPRQEAGSAEDRQIQQWTVQQYASMALQRPLSEESLVALERRARAGSSGPPLEPALWEDFKDWFSKFVRALKQVLINGCCCCCFSCCFCCCFYCCCCCRCCCCRFCRCCCCCCCFYCCCCSLANHSFGSCRATNAAVGAFVGLPSLPCSCDDC